VCQCGITEVWDRSINMVERKGVFTESLRKDGYDSLYDIYPYSRFEKEALQVIIVLVE
jgi:hypothetical protein